MLENLKNAIAGKPITRRGMFKAVGEAAGVAAASTTTASVLSSCAPGETVPTPISNEVFQEFTPLSPEQVEQLEDYCKDLDKSQKPDDKGYIYDIKNPKILDKNDNPIRMINPDRKEVLNDNDWTLFSSPTFNNPIGFLKSEEVPVPFLTPPVALIQSINKPNPPSNIGRPDTDLIFHLYRLSSAHPDLVREVGSNVGIMLGGERFVLVCNNNTSNIDTRGLIAKELTNFIPITEGIRQEVIDTLKKQTSEPETPTPNSQVPSKPKNDKETEESAEERVLKERIKSYIVSMESNGFTGEIEFDHIDPQTYLASTPRGNIGRTMPSILSEESSSNFPAGSSYTPEFHIKLTFLRDGKRIVETWGANKPLDASLNDFTRICITTYEEGKNPDTDWDMNPDQSQK